MSKMNEKSCAAPFRCTMSMEGSAGVISVEGEIGFDASPIDFCDKVDAALAAGATELTVRINLPGGVCYDGLSMGEKLRSCGVPTTGIVIGSAMSMAGYLLQCCDKRQALASATIMVHQPSAALWGPVDELYSAARYFVKMRDAMFETMGARCGMSGVEFSALHQSMKFYSAAEALALGLVDEVLGAESEPEEAERKGGVEQPVIDGGVPMPVAGSSVRLFDARAISTAFTMAATSEEGATEEGAAEEGAAEEGATEEEATEEEATEEEATEEEAAEEGAAEEGATEEGVSEVEAAEESIGSDDDETEPVPVPEKEAAQAYISREEHLRALAEQESRIYANLGVSASCLPAPVATEGGRMRGAGGVYTLSELDAMPAMRRLEVLRANPELAAAYAAHL